MSLLDSLSIAWEAIWARKIRSFLTVLGILVGVAAVIAVVSIGQTTRTGVTRAFGRLGPNLLWIVPGRAGAGPLAAAEEGGFTLNLEDAKALAEAGSLLDSVAPVLQTPIEVGLATERRTVTLVGTTPDFLMIRQLRLRRGRSLEFPDIAERRRVAVLGASLARLPLSAAAGGLGSQIIIDGRAFDVVGHLESEGQVLGMDLDNQVYIPLTTAQQLNVRYASFLLAKAKDTVSLSRVKSRLREILLERYPHRDITILTQSQLMASSDAILGHLTVALSSIAAISLFVGGIGVMNILLISVSERTREIGIRKAIGARKADILTQFLAEGVTISLLGGLLGLLLGAGISFFASQSLLHLSMPLFSLVRAVVLAVSFSFVIGIVFSVYPAWRAAALQPAEAIQREI